MPETITPNSDTTPEPTSENAAKSHFAKAVEEAKAGAQALGKEAQEKAGAYREKASHASDEWANEARAKGSEATEKAFEFANEGKAGASQAISRALPGVQTIIMSVQSESDYLRKAMLAGARDFLMTPFSGDEVAAAIRRVYESRPAVSTQPVAAAGQAPAGGQGVVAGPRGHIITVFSPKGGSGCTTIAANLAAALVRDGHKTILVDGSLQFGDVAFMLNLKPTTTLVDLTERMEELDADLVVSADVIRRATGEPGHTASDAAGLVELEPRKIRGIADPLAVWALKRGRG